MNYSWLAITITLLLAASGSVRGEFENFDQCLESLATQAEAQGRSPAVLALVESLEAQQKVLELDRNQPEFVQTFGRYLALRLSDTRLESGRAQRRERAALLQELTTRYGVPGHYLIAFWGLESNYGGYLGNTPTLDALATLACDPRRSDFFSQEFLIALELVEREALNPDVMRGSWAGAMGHTQFMPSTWQRYARDGDGDQRIDLWNSEADALASAANFLAQLGWVRGQRWGREVRLPPDFAYELAGRQQPRALADWAQLGVRRADGGDLPVADLEAALLVPAGANGPAFLVYDNFNVIMGWNHSEAYALSVGLLADQIAGSAGLVQEPPDEPALARAQIKAAQGALAARGFDPGPADGLWGPASRSALSAYQAAAGERADGHLDQAALGALLAPRDSGN